MTTKNARELTEASVEARLAELLQQERFAPQEAFAAQAEITDPEIRARAAADPTAYWAEQAGRLRWSRAWDQVLDSSEAPFYRWFSGGTINVSDNCLDRHVEAGRGDKVAYHWHGEEGETRDITYAWLLERTARFAGALRELGVGKGDVVGIYLPMIPEVVVAMLACTRIGAVHNVVFGGFSAGSVAERMEVSGAKVLVTADGARRKGRTAPIKPSVDEHMGPEAVPSLQRVVVVRNTGIDVPMTDGRDVWFDEVLEAADAVDPEPMDAEAPLFILYSSGSTAKPKGILHTTGGYLTGASTTHRQVFDLHDDDVYFCSADVGWITGHSYIVYGPLANGVTSVMYEGAPDYPHKGIWWELCERRGVTKFYTAPTAIRACMKWGVEHVAPHDLSSLKLLGSVGEPINPKAWLWYWHVVGGERCPVVDTWWQTETGAIVITTLPGLDAAKPGSAGLPLPGYEVQVLDAEQGGVVEEGEGLLAIPRPWPSMLRTLYQDPDRYVSTYWDRFGPTTYFVGDSARRDADGYTWVIGRVDDVINVSGHRLSTAEVESAIVAHPAVAESAVVAKADDLTGQAIVAYVTLQGGTDASADVEAEINATIADRIGKLARPKRIVFTQDLPKTRSGKIMRRLLRDIAEERDLGDTTTLADPSVVDQLQQRWQQG
ncbi:acetate--CoA ligase [Patulibacter brassicae]|jgi:acetyl-CoA synthetase|uniref:Acetate--CoA ligase n=1 Tax=Patulibacter brassicae TaxID=1705717 RepID=A0ABU4VJQ4_9ACTN|nr:acetate--CoA ligase [Patulibacter brassicae]MDX8151040.1 acetate--CoA ligase [Patulibacter brassicae]